MPRYGAFLRGINLPGRKATGDQLRAAFEALGFDGVTTFRASGNVIFDAGGRVAGASIERGLKESLGYEVATFVRTGSEIRAIAGRQPFEARRVKASKGKLHVALLPKKPSAQARKKMLALRSEDDLFAIDGRELYWLPSGGLMQSAVGMSGITDVLGSNTVRTMGTIEQIAAKYFAH